MRRLALGLGLACLSLGCASPQDELETSDAPPRESKVQAPPSPGPDPLRSGLDAALARGIESPAEDDATYRIDPFVATLVYETLKTSKGAPWFERHAGVGEGPEPKAGFRVVQADADSLPAQLGLQKGDIVVAINGEVLGDGTALSRVLDGAENRVRLEVFRNGFSFTISYRFETGLAWTAVLVGAGHDATPRLAATTDRSADEGDAEPDAPTAERPVRSGSSQAPSAGPGVSPPRARPGSSSPARPSRPGTSSPRPRPATPRPGSSTPSSSASPISCSGSQCTVTRQHFEVLAASPERLQSQVRIVPAIRNDVFSGYKIKSVTPGSSVSKLGFRPEDKLTHVNGYDLTDGVQAMQLYLSLSTTRLFKIRYERGGRPTLKTIAVRG